MSGRGSELFTALTLSRIAGEFRCGEGGYFSVVCIVCLPLVDVVIVGVLLLSVEVDEGDDSVECDALL